MECRDIREKLIDFWDGKLEKALEDVVEKHLLSCSACTKELEYLKNSDKLLEKWKGLEPSPYFDIRLQQKIDQEEVKIKKIKTGWFYFSLLAASAIIAFIVLPVQITSNASSEVFLKVLKMEGAAIVRSKGVESPLTVLLSIKEGDIIETGEMTGVDIEITKNSTIRLKENSVVCVGKSRQKKGVEEYVFQLFTGEILAKVKKTRETLSFVVNTPNSNVHVTGTAFKVAVVNDISTSVLVSEGTVNVSKAENKNESCTVAAGRYVTVSDTHRLAAEVLGAKEKAEMEEIDIMKERFIFAERTNANKENGAGNIDGEDSIEEKECDPPENTEKVSSEKVIIARGKVTAVIKEKDNGNRWVRAVSTTGQSKNYMWPWRDASIYFKISRLKVGDKVVIKWYVNNHLRIKDITPVK